MKSMSATSNGSHSSFCNHFVGGSVCVCCCVFSFVPCVCVCVCWCLVTVIDRFENVQCIFNSTTRKCQSPRTFPEYSVTYRTIYMHVIFSLLHFSQHFFFFCRLLHGFESLADVVCCRRINASMRFFRR